MSSAPIPHTLEVSHAKPVRRRDTDRKPRGHLRPCSARAGRGRRHRVRGHAHHAQAPDALRYSHTDAQLPGAQRRRANPAATAGAVGTRRRAGDRSGHPRRQRPRREPRRCGAIAGRDGRADSRPLGGDCGGVRLRLLRRPLPIHRLAAAPRRGPPSPLRVPGGRAGCLGRLGVPPPGPRDAGLPCRPRGATAAWRSVGN